MSRWAKNEKDPPLAPQTYRLNSKALMLLGWSCLILGACAIAQEGMPTNRAPTATLEPSTATPTLAVTATPTQTLEPTAMPSIPGLAVDVPDPAYVASALFDLEDPFSPIPQFVQAMKKVGVEVEPEEVKGNLSYSLRKSASGDTLVVGSFKLDLGTTVEGRSLNGGVPLLLGKCDQDFGSCQWDRAWLGDLFRANGQTVDAFVVLPPSNNAYDEYLGHIADRTDVSLDIVFNRFGLEDWHRVLDEWGRVSTLITQGDIPPGFPYDWARSDREVHSDMAYGLAVRCSRLLYPTELATAVNSGEFTHDDLVKLLEFTTKVKVLRYRDRVHVWSFDEYNTYYGNPYLRRFGYQLPHNIATWVKEVQPDSTVLVTEDDVIQPDYGTYIYQGLFGMLRYFKTHDTPVDGVILEDNVWVRDPPRAATVGTVLNRIKDMGFEISGAEATVSLGYPFPLWDERPARVGPPQSPLLAQADIYSMLVQEYLDVGAPSFGFGGLDDDSWITDMGYPDAGPLILDKDDNAKPAYYAIALALVENLEN